MNVQLTIAAMIMGGLAVDVSNAIDARTKLQITADAAAHAALYTRELDTPENARARALALVGDAMPAEIYGTVMDAADISFGSWDAATQAFVPDDSLRDAVLVTTRRQAGKAGALTTFLLGFIGFDAWDIAAQSVFETYFPACFREGIVGEGVVDLRGNNTFDGGTCVHSNARVEVNASSVFETAAVVSMPDKRDIEQSSMAPSSSSGLDEALHDGAYRLRILGRIDEIVEGVQLRTTGYSREYITNSTPVLLSSTTVTETDLVPGRVHRLSCPVGQRMTVSDNLVLQNVVIVTNCPVTFGSGARMENAVLVTTSTDPTSVVAPAGIQIGRNDNCGTGGDAQLVTYGGVEIGAGLKVFGGQILAMGDIGFSADENGIRGAAIVAGGAVYGMEDMHLNYCGGRGMENNFEAAYFRLAA
jgi:hypothetical protein